MPSSGIRQPESHGAVGLAPMAYLLNRHMALAKTMLQRGEAGIAEIAERVGYGSASAFSVSQHLQSLLASLHRTMNGTVLGKASER